MGVLNDKHPGLVKMIDSGTGTYTSTKGVEKKVRFMVFEYIDGACLHSFLNAELCKFDEALTQYFFKQFVEQVKVCHENGIANRDLKCENIMIDDQGGLRLIDFGLCVKTANDEDKICSVKVGTEQYNPPEVQEGEKYNPMMLDIFSCGVVLFTMMFGNYPFAKATKRDAAYKCIINGGFDKFWKHHEKKSGIDKSISDEFKDLFQQMVNPNPARRPTADEILNHSWFQTPSATPEQALNET